MSFQPYINHEFTPYLCYYSVFDRQHVFTVHDLLYQTFPSLWIPELLQLHLHFQYNSGRCRCTRSRSDARCVEEVIAFVCAASATVILYDLCMCPAGTLCDRTGPGLFQHDDLSYRANQS